MGTFSVRRSAFGSRRGGRPGGCFPRREALGGHPQRPGSRKRLPSKACQGRVLTLDILRHANAGSFAYIAAFLLATALCSLCVCRFLRGGQSFQCARSFVCIRVPIKAKVNHKFPADDGPRNTPQVYSRIGNR
jgi:hypothetical protein